MTIRVLHIIGSLGLGGAQVCVKQLVEHNDDPAIEHVVYPLRSRQIDIPIDGTVIKLDYPNYDPRKFFVIFSLCKKYKIDIIHAHLHKPIIAALIARFFLRVPVIVHEHGSIAIKGFQYALYRFMLGELKNKASRYVAVSNSIAKDLQRYAKIPLSAITVVYNAVDLNRFTPDAAQRTIMRKELAIEDKDIVIGYVGRLSYEKGPDILLDAFALLIQNNPNFLLVFVGEGDMKASLQAKAERLGIDPHIKFLGFRKNVAEIMSAIDLGCIPSRQEAFGLSAIEFMGMKIPLIASDAAGLGEILTDRDNALLLTENTPEHLCRCVLELAGDPTLKQKLIDKAYRHVQNFSIPSFVQQMNKVYLDSVNNIDGKPLTG